MLSLSHTSSGIFNISSSGFGHRSSSFAFFAFFFPKLNHFFFRTFPMRSSATIRAASIASACVIVAAPTVTVTPAPSPPAAGVGGGACGSSHRLVGFGASLSRLQHQLAGTVTGVDDCTFRVTGFTMTSAPAAYWWGARSSSRADLLAGFKLSDARLVGSFSGTTQTVTLADGLTFDDFAVISVWCYAYDANFGHIVLPPPPAGVPAALDLQLEQPGCQQYESEKTTSSKLHLPFFQILDPYSHRHILQCLMLLYPVLLLIVLLFLSQDSQLLFSISLLPNSKDACDFQYVDFQQAVLISKINQIWQLVL